jgi:membrane protease YdiL (CAAX protease family)
MGLKILRDRVYDLPGQLPMRIAVVSAIVYFVLPSFWYFPLSELYGIGVIFYFVKRGHGLDQFGLTRSSSPKAKKAVFITFFGTVLLLVVLICLGMIDNANLTSEQASIRHQAAYPYPLWPPDNRIADAFAQRDMHHALLYSVKPFIFLAILAPVFETIFAFGIVFPALFRRFGYRKALWWLTIVFTLAHLGSATNLVALSLIFASAVAMCVLYAETMSLYPSIILHICHNILIYALYFVVNWGRAKG